MDSCTDSLPVLDDWVEAVQLAAAWDAAAARAAGRQDEAPGDDLPPGLPGC